MQEWSNRLYKRLSEPETVEEIFHEITATANQLGFEYCAYGLRLNLPITLPEILLISNHPEEWRQLYSQEGYIFSDQTVLYGLESNESIIWSVELFKNAPQIWVWSGARSSNLRAGWAQSNYFDNGVVGTLSLAGSNESVISDSLREHSLRIQILAQIAHPLLAKKLIGSSHAHQIRLTRREVEIFKWIADGKTSRDISDIMNISVDTVNFHVKNVINKLGVSNKTAAVAQTILKGLLM